MNNTVYEDEDVLTYNQFIQLLTNMPISDAENLLNNLLNMVIIMCRGSDTPIDTIRFSYNPEYVENEVIYTYQLKD